MSKTFITDQCLTAWAHKTLSDEPDVRGRKMFGCPAFFVGRRMFACVYHGTFAMKLPPAQVTELLAADQAHPFRPYGKPQMSAWCALDSEHCNTATSDALLLRALTWARLGHPSSKPTGEVSS